MSDDDILDEVIGEYQTALDTGQPLNRAELLAKYPHLVGPLNAYFADHDRLERITKPLRKAAETATAMTQLWANAEPVAADSAFPEVPGYEIQRCLGQGGMGVVYLAPEHALKRPVALKMMLSRADASQRGRFRQEAEAVAALQHPNIVQIFAIGEASGAPYLTLEYLEGGSLQDRLRKEKKLSPEATAELIATLARAVHHAHGRGILHRDLKPANVLFTREGIVKVSDFGLAKRLDGADGLTLPGTILGTAGYMAPEQAQGKELGPRTDVYALGAILYECLTGRPPFTGQTALEVILKACQETAQFPEEPVSDLERRLQRIALRCLEKDPARRPVSAEALAEELDGIHERLRSRMLQWAVTLMLVVVAVATMAVLWRLNRNGDSPPVVSTQPEERRIVTRAEMIGRITTDRAEHPERRYLTLGWLVNDPKFSEQDRQSFRELLGRIGEHQGITLAPLNGFDAVYALDWTGLDGLQWEQLLGGDPYSLQFEADMVPPLARADWIVRRLAITGELSVEGLEAWAARLASRPVDLETATAEIGLKDENRITELIREQPRLVEKFGLGPLIEGKAMDRRTWESTDYGVSPFQELVGELRLGVPLPLG